MGFSTQVVTFTICRVPQRRLPHLWRRHSLLRQETFFGPWAESFDVHIWWGRIDFCSNVVTQKWCICFHPAQKWEYWVSGAPYVTAFLPSLLACCLVFCFALFTLRIVSYIFLSFNLTLRLTVYSSCSKGVNSIFAKHWHQWYRKLHVRIFVH